MGKTTFRGGVHPAGNKELSCNSALKTYLPTGDLVFLTSQHIGKPAKPVVKKGDKVLVGQILAEADGFVSANIASSVSGTVKAVEIRKTAMGGSSNAIIVENDQQYTLAEGVGKETDPDKLTGQEIIDRVRAAGIVGMGGAGFPTHVKLTVKKPETIDYVIANGAECEPYITCDDRLMQERADEIAAGLDIILKLFPNAKGIVLIEENKPKAIESMKKACEKYGKISVFAAKTRYPQGGERSIISVVTNRHLKVGMLPADVGCVVDNVATVRAIYRAVRFNEPLTERGFTVTGDCITEPSNLIVKIGTLHAELVAACGGYKPDMTPKKLLSGGPMMGIAMTTEDIPVCKNNNALTALSFDEAEIAQAEMTACLRCGRCSRVCPNGLSPQLMQVAAERKDYDRYENKLYGLDCIACGCCSYICPARRPLMQLFKLTKAEIMAAKKR